MLEKCAEWRGTERGIKAIHKPDIEVHYYVDRDQRGLYVAFVREEALIEAV